MADQIEIRDAAFLAQIPELFDGKGWHGKGIPTVDFSKENIRKVLFPFSVEPAGVYFREKFIPTGEFYAVAGDDGLPIGDAVGKNWQTPNNEELFDVFSEALSGSDYKIVSVLTVQNRVQFAIDAKGPTIKAGTRDLAPFVGLHRPFGGVGKLFVAGHGQVMQCANTTAIFRREASKGPGLISSKNTARLRERLPEIQKSIEMSHGVLGQFARAMAEAENDKVTSETATRAFVGFLTKDTQNLGAKTVSRVNRLSQLFKTGAGSSGGNNLADWFNAVTDLYTHESAGSESSAESKEEFREKQWLASEFGGASRIKEELATSLFVDGSPCPGVVANLAKIGRAVIEKADKEIAAELVFN